MTIHDDANAAARKVYDDAIATRETTISALTVRVDSLTAELAEAETSKATSDALTTELRTTIEALKARIAALETPPVKATDRLPFYADPDLLAKSDKKWLDHYFPVFPLTVENGAQKTDQYAKWLTREGEGGKFAVTGGRLRDRPISDAPFAGDWRRAGAAQEIRDAKKYLRDGFFVNLMSTAHAALYNALRDEANANHPGFLIVPMVDTNGSMANVADVNALPTTTLVDVVASFLTTKNTWTLADGSVAVASYKANGRTGSWWTDLAAKLKAKTGKTVSFVHVYNNSPTVADVKARAAYASGAWSIGADPNVIRASGSSATYKSAGRLLVGIQPQNIRPGVAYGPWFDEACNTEALRAGISKAIADGAEVIQGVTWSDLTEGGQFMPTVMRGTVALELSAMGIYEWKTGTKPKIVEDYVAVSHRNQTLDAKIEPAQTTLMSQNTTRAARSTVRNKVEVLTHLTAADTVTVDVGGSKTTYSAPAGEHAQLVDIAAGVVTVTTGRGIKLVSPVPVRSTVGAQDRQYAMASNLGPTDRQYDPTPA